MSGNIRWPGLEALGQGINLLSRHDGLLVATGMPFLISPLNWCNHHLWSVHTFISFYICHEYWYEKREYSQGAQDYDRKNGCFIMILFRLLVSIVMKYRVNVIVVLVLPHFLGFWLPKLTKVLRILLMSFLDLALKLNRGLNLSKSSKRSASCMVQRVAIRVHSMDFASSKQFDHGTLSIRKGHAIVYQGTLQWCRTDLHFGKQSQAQTWIFKARVSCAIGKFSSGICAHSEQNRLLFSGKRGDSKHETER